MSKAAIVAGSLAAAAGGVLWCALIARPRSRPQPDPHKNVHILRDLYEVSEDKPLGYLPLSTLRMHGRHPADFKRRGRRTLVIPAAKSRVFSGALYVYDGKALPALLERHRSTLEKAGWPTDPKAFIQHVDRLDIRQSDHPELYELIGVAYNDKRFRASKL